MLSPPPSGEFREDDSLGEYFNEPIVQVVDFAQAGAWPPEGIVSVRRGDGNAARLAVREVIENGSRRQRLVLEAELGPSDPEDGPASDPPGNMPTLLEFSTPQRAVAIEFGFICTSEAGCQTSSGRRGGRVRTQSLRPA